MRAISAVYACLKYAMNRNLIYWYCRTSFQFHCSDFFRRVYSFANWTKYKLEHQTVKKTAEALKVSYFRGYRSLLNMTISYSCYSPLPQTSYMGTYFLLHYSVGQCCLTELFPSSRTSELSWLTHPCHCHCVILLFSINFMHQIPWWTWVVPLVNIYARSRWQNLILQS